MIKSKTDLLIEKYDRFIIIWLVIFIILFLKLLRPFNICNIHNNDLGFFILYMGGYSILTYYLTLNLFVPLLKIYAKIITRIFIVIICGYITVKIIEFISEYIGIITKIIVGCA